MKSNHLRIYLIAVLMAGLILLSLSGTSPNRSASAGQGKGGEVIAKPTPTPAPKKTTLPKKRSAPAKSSKSSSNTGSNSLSEIAFWETIKNSTDPEDFKAYLEQYPKGRFASLAKNRLKTLEAAKSSTSPTPTNPSSANPGSTNPSPTKPTTAPVESGPAKPAPKAGAVVRNQIGMELVYVPSGSFMMGGESFDTEKPVHLVSIHSGFYMGKYEVTQVQWQQVMGANPSYFKNCDQCPVEQVSWHDAQEFINKLNERNDGFEYRLPTESEWEYACRAGMTGDYTGDLHDIAWYYDNSGHQTHPIGQKLPNGWGLYDMQGNVWEWCQDYWHENYNGAPSDGSAWLSGTDTRRVARGGSSNFYTKALCSFRDVRYTPALGDSFIGFRVVVLTRTQ